MQYHYVVQSILFEFKTFVEKTYAMLINKSAKLFFSIQLNIHRTRSIVIMKNVFF